LPVVSDQPLAPAPHRTLVSAVPDTFVPELNAELERLGSTLEKYEPLLVYTHWCRLRYRGNFAALEGEGPAGVALGTVSRGWR
jgi:hypothetical protein